MSKFPKGYKYVLDMPTYVYEVKEWDESEGMYVVYNHRTMLGEWASEEKIASGERT